MRIVDHSRERAGSLPERRSMRLAEAPANRDGDTCSFDFGAVARLEAMLWKDANWSEVAGKSPAECAFTLIVPIRDEARSLPHFLAHLDAQALPATMPATVLFITNGCSDDSAAIVHDYLSSKGMVNRSVVDGRLQNTVKIGALELTHLDIAEAGKAGALTLGNHFALARGHRIAMSLDADVKPGDDAIALLFRDASTSFTPERPRRCLISARREFVLEESGSLWNRYMQRQIAHQRSMPNDVVVGQMMAWDARWLESRGGFPPVAMEDFAAGCLARKDGMPPGRSRAMVTAQHPGTFRDYASMMSRFIRALDEFGAMHREDPEIKAMIREGAPYMGSPRERLDHALRNCGILFQKTPATILRYLLDEYCHYKALADRSHSPNSQSWEQLPSSKGPIRE